MGRRQTPRYYWDFRSPGEMPIDVHSDADWLPDPIASFDGPDAIPRAERLIEHLDAGRADPRRVAETFVGVSLAELAERNET